MSKYVVEYQTENIELVPSNLLLDNIEDMECLEEWEYRLGQILKVGYAVVYKKRGKKILYSIFTDLKRKGGVFKCVMN